MRIEIPAYKLASRNATITSHWRNYQAIRDEIKTFVITHLPKNYKMLEKPVNIRIDAYYKSKRRHDSDNIISKEIIDALCGKVIKDDDTRYVRDVTTCAHIGCDSDKVVITLEELQS